VGKMFFNISRGGTYSNHCHLRVKTLIL